MQWNEKLSPFIYIALLLAPYLALASVSSHPPLQGQFEQGVYTSPSGKFHCDIGKFETSPSFYLDEAYEPGISETMSFAVQKDGFVEIWLVRAQKEGRLDYLPESKEGFPITRETFIPYYYSELPYDITSIKRWKLARGKSEVLRVQMDDEAQLHAYWIEQSDGWLNSIQFMPTLVGPDQPKLELRQAKAFLTSVRERCTFE